MARVELTDLEGLRARGASVYVPASVVGDALLNGKIAIVEVGEDREFYEFKRRVRKYLARRGVDPSRIKHFKVEERSGWIRYALALQETLEKLILAEENARAAGAEGG